MARFNLLMKRLLFFAAFFSFVAAFSQEEIPVEEVRPLIEGPSVQEFYGYMQEALDDEDWWSAIDYAEIVLYHFPDSPFGQELPFTIGSAYYHLNQYELANTALTDYLRNSAAPKHFEEAIAMKFAIAEHYRQGGKKRLFGSHKLPAIVPAKEDALEIYDEVITTLPHHEIAIKALLGKAEIQAYLEDFKPSIETLQLLIRRFPKDELAAESYLRIIQVYLQQCKIQHQDPDLLDLAEMNLRKFRQAFPREPRLQQAELALKEIQELFAATLLETGRFYQKRKQTDASIIYYSKIIANFPRSKAAVSAKEQLEELQATGQF
jgi:outer membrane protein assembly factor BamD (BamD/ComL family)